VDQDDRRNFQLYPVLIRGVEAGSGDGPKLILDARFADTFRCIVARGLRVDRETFSASMTAPRPSVIILAGPKRRWDVDRRARIAARRTGGRRGLGVAAGTGLRYKCLGDRWASGRPTKAEMKKDVNRIFRENRRVIDEALLKGVREAMLRHKKDAMPVVIERDGKIEWVKPEDLGY
jgi:hypothetical protein